MNEVSEILNEIRELRREMSELRDEIRNFLGFFELDEKGIKEIDRDVEAYRKGELEILSVDDMKRALNI